MPKTTCLINNVMAENKEKLFSEFPPVSTEQWMEVITADLKGAPFDKKLIWRSKEGIDVRPFYRAEDIEGMTTKDVLPGVYPYVRGTKADNHWLIRQEVGVTGDLKEVNEKLKRIFTLGINAVGLHFTDEYVNADSVAKVLDGVDVSAVELNFYSCRKHAVEMAEAVVAAYRQMGADLSTVKGSINYNPFRHLLAKGNRWAEWKETGVALLKAIEPLSRFTCITVQSLDFVNAGAYIYQELGYALAAGADLMVQLGEAAQISPAKVAERMRFDMGVSSNFFMEIAKFRAMRWLWALIVKANDADASECATKAMIHAETSSWDKTVYDAYVNLLRSQTESMSAAIAGVHSLTVTPFNIAYTSDYGEFAERIARNQQLLLSEESHFDKVADPSGGSYYVEFLTQAIAEQGWKLFLEVEDEGGFYALAEQGKVQEAINASNTARHKAVATRRESLLGSNIFPNFTETAGEEKIKARKTPCGCKSEVTALDFSRGASEFEALRMATEMSEKTPKVFMLTIGNLAMRLARSQFSSNFFACAGYKIIDNLGFKTVKDGVDKALADGADIIVLCSSDDEYAEYGPQAFDEINGRLPLVIAGAPACMEDLKAKGIEHFVHVKVNVLETLRDFNRMLGINA